MQTSNDIASNIDTLIKLTEAFGNIKDSELLFQTIYRNLQPVFLFDVAAIFFFSEDRAFAEMYSRGVLVPKGFISSRPSNRISLLRLGRLFDVHSQQIQQIDTKELKFNIDEPRQRESSESIITLGIKVLTICPLIVSGQSLGMLLLGNGKNGLIRHDDLPFLRQACRIIAGAASNVNLLTRLSVRDSDSTLAISFASRIIDNQSFESLIRILPDALRMLRSYRIFSMVICHPNGRENHCMVYNQSNEFQLVPDVIIPPETNHSSAENQERIQIYYYDKQALSHFQNDSISSYRIEAAVHFVFKVSDSESIRIFIGGTNDQADKLLAKGIFEQIATPMYFAIQHMRTWENLRDLQNQLRMENKVLIDELSLTTQSQKIIGNSDPFRSVLSKIRQVAPTDSTVLLLGETGTGKEVLARYLHENSTRHNKAMVRVNCASIPSQLIESELFGHEKGSFTGAIDKRIGKFEIADGGTIFLDEIGELPLESQAKILRVLQEREFERVGGHKVISIDVRVIAATNRNLEDEIRKGNFRQDLFYRLNVFPIVIPPLRDRRADIPSLAEEFLQKAARRIGKKVRSLRTDEIELFLNYEWPGNVRELEHLTERIAITSSGADLDLHDLHDLRIRNSSGKQTIARPNDETREIPSLDEVIRSHIVLALQKTKGRVSGKHGAAIILGLNDKTLESKMRKFNLKRHSDIW